jgi:hypothetical protein
VLLDTPFSKQAQSFWVLVPKDNTSTINILAHCEVYEHPALLTTTPGHVRQVRCMAIGSVFCPVEHRGKGYAKQLMNLLYQQFKEDPTIHTSTLYSDIGPQFYDRIGWKTMPSKEIIISAHPSLPIPDNVRLIASSQEIDSFAAKDIELLHIELKNAQSPTFCVLPVAEKIHWIQRRAHFYFSKLSSWSIETLGAYIPETNNYVSFFYNYQEKAIYFLRMRSDNEQATKAFLAVAQREALRCNLDKIIVWDTPSLSDDQIKLQVIHQRDESISALAAYDVTSEVTWVCNEKYAWV